MQTPFDSNAGRVAVAGRAIRFLLTFLLLLMVYRGSVIAKWICIALFGLSCLIFIPAVLESPSIAPLLFIYVSCAVALLISKDIGEFLEQQRARRR